MRQDMFGYLQQRLRRHGVQLSDQRMRELLEPDVDLNCQGLEHWLDHAKA
jgi:hypothetical protein